MAQEQDTGIIELATDLTIAWLGNAHTRASADEVNAFLSEIHGKLGLLSAGSAPTSAADEPIGYTPAVSARKSLADPNVIISMIDGKPYRSLKRHLTTNGLTPAEYRQRYGLKADYPMVAPGYSEARRETAKRLGLGRKKGEAAPAKAGAAPNPSDAAPTKAAAAPKPRGRKSAAEAQAAAQNHLKG